MQCGYVSGCVYKSSVNFSVKQIPGHFGSKQPLRGEKQLIAVFKSYKSILYELFGYT